MSVITPVIAHKGKYPRPYDTSLRNQLIQMDCKLNSKRTFRLYQAADEEHLRSIRYHNSFANTPLALRSLLITCFFPIRDSFSILLGHYYTKYEYFFPHNFIRMLFHPSSLP